MARPNHASQPPLRRVTLVPIEVHPTVATRYRAMRQGRVTGSLVVNFVEGRESSCDSKQHEKLPEEDEPETKAWRMTGNDDGRGVELELDKNAAPVA